MFSHIMVGLNDLDRSQRFYDAVFNRDARVDDRGRLSYAARAPFSWCPPIDGQPASHSNGGTIDLFSTVPRKSMPGTRPGRGWRTIGRGSAGLPRAASEAVPAYSRSPWQQACGLHRPERPREIVSENRSHGGRQFVARHFLVGDIDRHDWIFPPQAAERNAAGRLVPVGLTCTHANVTEKGISRAPAELG